MRKLEPAEDSEIPISQFLGLCAVIHREQLRHAQEAPLKHKPNGPTPMTAHLRYPSDSFHRRDAAARDKLQGTTRTTANFCARQHRTLCALCYEEATLQRRSPVAVSQFVATRFSPELPNGPINDELGLCIWLLGFVFRRFCHGRSLLKGLY